MSHHKINISIMPHVINFRGTYNFPHLCSLRFDLHATCFVICSNFYVSPITLALKYIDFLQFLPLFTCLGIWRFYASYFFLFNLCCIHILPLYHCLVLSWYFGNDGQIFVLLILVSFIWSDSRRCKSVVMQCILMGGLNIQCFCDHPVFIAL